MRSSLRSLLLASLTLATARHLYSEPDPAAPAPCSQIGHGSESSPAPPRHEPEPEPVRIDDEPAGDPATPPDGAERYPAGDSIYVSNTSFADDDSLVVYRMGAKDEFRGYLYPESHEFRRLSDCPDPFARDIAMDLARMLKGYSFHSESDYLYTVAVVTDMPVRSGRETLGINKLRNRVFEQLGLHRGLFDRELLLAIDTFESDVEEWVEAILVQPDDDDDDDTPPSKPELRKVATYLGEHAGHTLRLKLDWEVVDRAVSANYPWILAFEPFDAEGEHELNSWVLILATGIYT